MARVLRQLDDEVIERPFNKNQFIRLLGYLKPYKNSVLLALVVMVAVTFAGLGAPYLMSRAVTLITEGQFDGIWLIFLGMAVLAAVGALLTRARVKLMDYAGRKALAQLREDLFKHVQSLSFSFFPNYIRAMHIDCDGVHIPPTERDIFYHTDQPLSDAGIALLKAIDCLLEADNQPLAEELLFPLFQITVEDLKVSDASPSERYLRPMRRWNQINAFLREHREESITRSQVARLFRISPGYVSELCRQNTGESFSQVKLHYQLERAENLLIHSGMNVNEIAAQCGFSSANYFIRRFRKAYGVTPHVYRNQQTKQPQ